jgi:hypothetical protein
MLAAQSNPSKFNSQDALLKMLDLMAHEQSGIFREYKLRSNYNGDPNKFITDDNSGYSTLHNQISRERQAIASHHADPKVIPSYYYLDGDKSSEAKPSSGTKSQGGADSSTMRSRLEKALSKTQ